MGRVFFWTGIGDLVEKKEVARGLVSELGLWIGLVLGLSILLPTPLLADEISEANAFFQAGNEHFQRATGLRGRARQRELEIALEQYQRSLDRVRSRNVLYNAALVLEELGRWEEAYNYWTEYLAIPGLSPGEAAEGRARRESIRPRVAVFVVRANTQAEVWVDRRDLAPRGRTPLEIALPPGTHVFYLSAPGHRDTDVIATGTRGTLTDVSASLAPLPIPVQVLAPDGATVEIDGAPLVAGQSTPIPPGQHLLRASIEGRPVVEQRFELLPGSPPMTLDLTSALAAATVEPKPLEGKVRFSINALAQIEIDGVLRAEKVMRHEESLTASSHRIRVLAPGRKSYEATLTFERFPVELEVQLGRETDLGIIAGRAIFGPLAVASIVAGGIALAGATFAYQNNQQNVSYESANNLRAWTLAVDISWVLAAVTGTLGLTFVAMDAGGEESRALIAFPEEASSSTSRSSSTSTKDVASGGSK
ncbi:MAG: PEGA domain-containing protein [Sandaracinaceae bacterium]|nr:PEGA domain-containing protein [Sandaracinaceae bacterium]MDW8245619.1 PEGA domain-containing protein [Sandaracinaceae bacterium]